MFIFALKENVQSEIRLNGRKKKCRREDHIR